MQSISIQQILSDNYLVAFEKFLQSSPIICEVISFLLYQTYDYSNHIIQNATLLLRFLIEGDMIRTSRLLQQTEKINLPDFYMTPTLNLYEDYLLHLISNLLQIKMKIYSVLDLSGIYCRIYKPQAKHKNKIHILKNGQENYPIWRKDYVDKYKFCQNIILELFCEKLDIEIEGLKFQLPCQQQYSEKKQHKKSLSLTMKTNTNDYFIDQKSNCILLFFQQNIDSYLSGSDQKHTISKKLNIPSLPSISRQFSQPVNSSQEFSSDYSQIFAQLSPYKNTNDKGIYTGRLKFFDEQKNYGFIIMDNDSSDIFVHYDDIFKAGVSKEQLKKAKHGYILRFQFQCMNYTGKYKESRKAIDLKLIQNYPTQEFYC